MSTDINRKKRTASAGANSTPDGDHRKRRRNRTTQSCLNCHTSKRMCDRKRPCGRCTQLGLTGLCVYEVDDLTQREPQDENSRLLKRVAELESVIRELKNKPHPRWVQKSSEEFDKTSTEAVGDASVDLTQDNQSLSDQDTTSNNRPTNQSHIPQLSSQTNRLPSQNLPPDDPSLLISRLSNTHSPFSTPSPSSMTPTDDIPGPHINIAGVDNDPYPGLDLASFFPSYPGLAEYEDSTLQLEQLLLHDTQKGRAPPGQIYRATDGHCGCLNEYTSYNVLLELSLRLRKAADTLRRSSNHLMGSNCLLNQRISELDTFATTVLGNIMDPPNNAQFIPPPSRTSVQNALRATSLSTSANANEVKHRRGSSSPQSLTAFTSWDFNSPLSFDGDDPLMTWDPRRS